MKDSNKAMLVNAVSQVINNEFQEQSLEIEKLNKLLKEKDEKISSLKKQAERIEFVERESTNYRLFYHMHTAECPQCKGEGGLSDGYGGGCQCSVCKGSGNIDTEEAKKYILNEIRNNKK